MDNRDVLDSPLNVIGQPPTNTLDNPGVTLSRDTNRGNPDGDVVDNSASANRFLQSISQSRSTGHGGYLHMASIAPNIYKSTDY